jgi:hypothetical protein
MSADAVRVRPEDPAAPGAVTLADELKRFPNLTEILAALPDNCSATLCLPAAGWIEVSRTGGNRFRFHPLTPEELVFKLLPAGGVDA